MEEVLQAILLELKEINSKLDSLQGYGPNKSISDVCSELHTMNNSISDINGSLAGLRVV